MSSAVPKMTGPADYLRPLAIARLPASGALRDVKLAALEHFVAQGFPTTRDEDWKYTSLKRLENRTFALANAAPVSAEDVANISIAAPDWLQLVFVNGHFAPALSSAVATPLAAASQSSDEYRTRNSVSVETAAATATLTRTASPRTDCSADDWQEDSAAKKNPFAAVDQARRQDVADSAIDSLNIMSSLAKEFPDRVAALLASERSDRLSSLTALNAALTEDGLVLELADGMDLAQPIYCLFLWTALATPAMTHPRIVVRLGRGARATLIEHYVGSEPSRTNTRLTAAEIATSASHPIVFENSALAIAGVLRSPPPRTETFTNTVTQIQLGPQAYLEHYRLQEEGSRSFHLGETVAELQRDANFISYSFAFGAQLSRVSTDVYLTEAGAHAALRGLFFASGTSHSDVHTRIEHVAPRTTSLQNFRGIADGRGRGVFNGKVRVAEQAQKIVAEQSSRNLLLSPLCEIDTKPELEIYADDVKCSHGATTGQLDMASLFYLRSRGIEEAEARSMLTEAFAASVLSTIELAPLREHLAGTLRARLGRKEGA